MKKIVFVFLACVFFTPITVHADQAFDWRERQYVSLEDLRADPLAFVGKDVCTEAYVRVEYEGMMLYVDGMRPEDRTYVNVYPPFGLDYAIEHRIHTGDRVFARGVFEVQEACLRGYIWAHLHEDELASLEAAKSDDDPEDDTFCFPMLLPTWLSGPRFELTEQIPPQDRCVHIYIHELYAGPTPYEYQLVCFEAVLEDGETGLYLVPEELYGNLPDSGPHVEIRTLHAPTVQEVRDGATVWAIGWIRDHEPCMAVITDSLDAPCPQMQLPATLQLYDFYYADVTQGPE